MHLERVIPVVDYHTEGNPARIILDGFGPLPGRTPCRKRRSAILGTLGVRGPCWRKPSGR
jgi:proline racemase